MDYRWTQEEIRLTRFAWAMKDADDWLARRALARTRLGIVVAAGMCAALSALFVLSQW